MIWLVHSAALKATGSCRYYYADFGQVQSASIGVDTWIATSLKMRSSYCSL
jgi:hypothetical protein